MSSRIKMSPSYKESGTFGLSGLQWRRKSGNFSNQNYSESTNIRYETVVPEKRGYWKKTIVKTNSILALSDRQDSDASFPNFFQETFFRKEQERFERSKYSGQHFKKNVSRTIGKKVKTDSSFWHFLTIKISMQRAKSVTEFWSSCTLNKKGGWILDAWWGDMTSKRVSRPGGGGGGCPCVLR